MLLIGCFFPWLTLASSVSGLESSVYFHTVTHFLYFIFFDTKFGGYFLYSAIFIAPVAFIIVSIVRRKISIWEVCIIIATWCLIFYVSPHLRG